MPVPHGRDGVAMTILIMTLLVLLLIAALVISLVAVMLLAELVWRRAATADIIRRAEHLLSAHAA